MLEVDIATAEALSVLEPSAVAASSFLFLKVVLRAVGFADFSAQAFARRISSSTVGFSYAASATIRANLILPARSPSRFLFKLSIVSSSCSALTRHGESLSSFEEFFNGN
jgi:hypothetical protein